MTSRDIGIVICRVGAVLLLVQAVQSVVYSFDSYGLSGLAFGEFLKTVALIATGPLVGGLALWFLAGKISSSGSSRSESDSILEESSAKKADIIAAGTYLLGVYVLVFSVVGAIEITALSMYPRLFADMAGLADDVPNPHSFSRQAGNFAQALLGIGLIIVGRRSG